MAVKFDYSDLMYHLVRLNEVCSDDVYGVLIFGDGKYYLLSGLLSGLRLVFESESIGSMIAKIDCLYSSFSDK